MCDLKLKNIFRSFIFLCFFSLSSVDAAYGEDNDMNEYHAHSLLLTSGVLNIGSAVFLHAPEMNSQICYYSAARAVISTTDALVKSLQNYLPTDLEDWFVENGLLSKRNPEAISQNTAYLIMQTVRVNCYMQASKILSRETCEGTPGNLYLASIYFVTAGLLDWFDHINSKL